MIERRTGALSFRLVLAMLVGLAAALPPSAVAQTRDAKPIATEREWVAALRSRLERGKRLTPEARAQAKPGWHDVRVSFLVALSG